MATEADNELRQRVTEPQEKQEKPEQVYLASECRVTCAVNAGVSVRGGQQGGGARLSSVYMNDADVQLEYFGILVFLIHVLVHVCSCH